MLCSNAGIMTLQDGTPVFEIKKVITNFFSARKKQ